MRLTKAAKKWVFNMSVDFSVSEEWIIDTLKRLATANDKSLNLSHIESFLSDQLKSDYWTQNQGAF
jgi:hypothetical protein